MNSFVESLKRLFCSGMIKKPTVDKLLLDKKITKSEYEYIMQEKEV